jgi:collagen type XIV alpha
VPVVNVLQLLILAPLDMVFIVDGFGLVGSQTFKVLKDFVKQIMHAFIISTQSTRVGFAQITESGHVDFNLDEYSDVQELDDAIDAIPLKGGDKRLARQSVAIAYTSIFQTTGRRGLVPRVLITVTTGKSEDDVGLVGQDLRKQKIVSIVVSVGENVDKPQGIQLATTPEHSFAPDDVAKLPPVVQDVVERINKGLCFLLCWFWCLCCFVAKYRGPFGKILTSTSMCIIFSFLVMEMLYLSML